MTALLAAALIIVAVAALAQEMLVLDGDISPVHDPAAIIAS